MTLRPGDIYPIQVRGRTMYAIRGNNPNGFGGDLHATRADAEYWRDIAAARETERLAALARVEEESAKAQEREQAHLASFHGFIETGLAAGRRRAVLEKCIRYNGVVMSRKTAVERAHAAGATANPNGTIEYPGGRFVDLGKTAAAYLTHLNTHR